ncbi:MaoC family dehydratase N-terminal domain-containing protein [Nonomuraea sp. NPDC049486]|uniref:FAS1-like dehydratase domain-containing protein n=1 Tax=Nonomuraea sp. NPDC049486 TaxID=3155773 RepID=UPI00341649D8
MAVERFPVEGGHIMMFARAVGDPHPAYHGAITGTPAIAPPTFVWAADHYDPDSAVRPKPDEPWPGSGATPSGAPAADGAGLGLHAEQRYEYHRPVREGDVLSAVDRPGRTWRKEGRRGGALTFTETITEYRDQRGEPVVTATMVTVTTSTTVGAGG